MEGFRREDLIEIKITGSMIFVFVLLPRNQRKKRKNNKSKKRIQI